MIHLNDSNVDEVIILAGGLGTRLQSVVNDVPKPMALVNNIPFLDYLLEWLILNKIKKVIISVGYKAEVITHHYKNKYKNLSIRYSYESRPLGTGGAIKKAIKAISNDNCFIINGDTFFNIKLFELLSICRENSADIVMSLNKVKFADRYGIVHTDENKKVISFEDKKESCDAYINGGIYLVKKSIFTLCSNEVFSFEDFLKKQIENQEIKIYGYKTLASFIDIGVPFDYFKAAELTDLQNLFSN